MQLSYTIKSLLGIFAMALVVITIGANTVAALGDQTIQVGKELNAFSPAEVTIQVGETVTWENVNGWHNVVSYDMDGKGKPLFTSGDPDLTQWQYSYTFTEAGVYEYYCQPHESAGMTGTITVESPRVLGMNRFDSKQTLPMSLSAIGLGLIGFGTLLGRRYFFIDES